MLFSYASEDHANNELHTQNIWSCYISTIKSKKFMSGKDLNVAHTVMPDIKYTLTHEYISYIDILNAFRMQYLASTVPIKITCRHTQTDVITHIHSFSASGVLMSRKLSTLGAADRKMFRYTRFIYIQLILRPVFQNISNICLLHHVNGLVKPYEVFYIYTTTCPYHICMSMA